MVVALHFQCKMIFASWNVNSIRVRLSNISKWINKRKPDFILFQEIKCQNEDFPEIFFKDLGYKSFINGQKGRNGTAILVLEKLWNKDDLIDSSEKLNFNSQARFIKYYFKNLNIHICNIYAPNGNPINEKEKFDYKLNWYDELKSYIKPFIENEAKIIVGGDFNVLENSEDAKNFLDWEKDALGDIKIRKKFRSILGLGMTNISRNFFEPGKLYSFWDYQKSAWERNYGLLIDHFICSPHVAEKIVKFGVDSETRGWDRPSDHAPIWIELY